jgi:hypothetical protein
MLLTTFLKETTVNTIYTCIYLTFWGNLLIL